MAMAGFPAEREEGKELGFSAGSQGIRVSRGRRKVQVWLWRVSHLGSVLGASVPFIIERPSDRSGRKLLGFLFFPVILF
jgi:hypothetical protein